MGGAPTGRQPIDQAVAVGGEGRQEFVPGILRSSQASRQVPSWVAQQRLLRREEAGRVGVREGMARRRPLNLHDLSVSTGSLSLCPLNWLFSLFPISLSLSFLPAFPSCPQFICLF
jgi:hypothetical protein